MPNAIRSFSVFASLTLAALAGIVPSASAKTRSFQVFAELVGKTKFWVPHTLVVNEGDTVHIEAINNIPGPVVEHGFMIEAFNVKELVGREKKVIEFKADREGIFEIRCHLHHPVHVGGQLVVLD